MCGGLIEVYVSEGGEGRRESFVNSVKTANEYLGSLKNTFSTLKLFWDFEPQE